MLHIELLQELLKVLDDELSIVVSYYVVWQVVSTDDVFSQKILFLSNWDSVDGLGLDPLGEVINGYY